MALDRLQEHVARVALALPQARTLALAGGCAMIAHELVDRVTKDVDLFTEFDSQEALAVAAALRLALGKSGFEIRNAPRPPHENRFVVCEPASGRSVEVEVSPDGGRLRPRVTLDVGPVLHWDDLAADKTLALWARAEPRDFVDVIALRRRYGGARLLQLAAEKDRGFTVAYFVDALKAINRISPARWTAAGISPQCTAEITQAVTQWLAELSG